MSSVHVFGELSLISNIITVLGNIRIICNAVPVKVTPIGTLKVYGDYWYHQQALSSILSLSNMQKMFRVSYDSKNSDQVVAHKDDNTTRDFSLTYKGIYISWWCTRKENIC